MAQVLDYSAGFPGAQAIRDAGYAGAVRYIGFPDRRKCATAGELADFSAHGLGMGAVYEDTNTTWRGGYNAGQAAGQRARNHARAIGFPDHRPIYIATDQDVVTSGEYGVMLDYLRGAGDVLGGPALIGVYGEADVIDRARDAGVASYFWQTAAWSRGRRTTAHLYQHVGTVYVGGIACDVNDASQEYWGQHNFEEDDMSAQDAYVGVASLLRDINTPGKATDEREALIAVCYNALTRLAHDMDSGVAGDIRTILTQMATRSASPITDEQVVQLATSLAGHLGDDLADTLGRKLIRTPTV